MRVYKATFPDRVAPEKGVLPLNYLARMDVVDRPTSQIVRASNKREAWDKIKQAFPFERIVIEEVGE